MVTLGMRHVIFSLLLATLLAATAPALAVKWGPQRLTFAGGPAGGSFDEVSKNTISRINANLPEVALSYSISGGSVENLRRINSAEADLGIVYAGDIFLGRIGRLPYDVRTYDRVLALAVLYEAPAQLMVRAGSNITSVQDLVGRRIAVGGIGSGAAAAAQRYFTGLGLWDRIRPEFTGYQDAISALAHNYVDAIWVFAGLPNPTVSQAARSYPIRLLDLAEAAEQAELFAQYPFFTRTRIPAGIYSGINEPVETIGDFAVWVAGAHVSTEVIEKIMGAAHDTKPNETPLFTGHQGSITPLHPGADAFWQSQREPGTP